MIIIHSLQIFLHLSSKNRIKIIKGDLICSLYPPTHDLGKTLLQHQSFLAL